MPRRTMVIFWIAVVAAVGFLGTAWAAWYQDRDGARIAVLVVSACGLVAAGLVAGRIIVVAAAAGRRAGHGNPPASPRRRGSATPGSGHVPR